MADVIAHDMHPKIAEIFKADKATASHINHAFRTEETKDKPYITIKKATDRISLFKLAAQLVDRKLLIKLLEAFIKEGMKHGVIPTLNRRPYIRLYKKPNFTMRADIAQLIKDVVQKYWIKGHRQNLAIRIAGVLYRHVTKDKNQLLALMDIIIPKDDEERMKRFDPIYHIDSKKRIYGLNGLIKYIKEYIDPNFDDKPYKQYSKEKGFIEVPFKTRDERKRHHIFEIQQAILLVVVSLIAFNVKEFVEIVDNQVEVRFPTFKKLQELLQRLMRSEDQKYVFQSYILKKAMNQMRDSGIFDIRYQSRGFTITFEIETLNKIYTLITWDDLRNQYIIFHLYKRIHEGMWSEDVIQQRLKDKLNMRGCRFLWASVLLETANPDFITIALKEALLRLSEVYKQDTRLLWSLSQHIETFITSPRNQDWANYTKAMKILGILPFMLEQDYSPYHREKLKALLFFRNFETFEKFCNTLILLLTGRLEFKFIQRK